MRICCLRSDQSLKNVSAYIHGLLMRYSPTKFKNFHFRVNCPFNSVLLTVQVRNFFQSKRYLWCQSCTQTESQRVCYVQCTKPFYHAGKASSIWIERDWDLLFTKTSSRGIRECRVRPIISTLRDDRFMGGQGEHTNPQFNCKVDNERKRITKM